MNSRQLLGSWLSGPKAALEADGVAPVQDDRPPGVRLGLPASGSGAVAGVGRRLLALVLDWVASLLFAQLVFRPDYPSSASSGLTLGVFVVQVALLTWLGGASFGQRLLRIRVVGLGRRIGPLAALLRTVLIALVVPPLIYDRDGRGLHDKAVGSVAVRA